jgi:hypothetical protein
VERVFGASGVWDFGGVVFGWHGDGFAIEALSQDGVAPRAPSSDD